MESVVYSMFFRIDPLVIWHSPSLSVSQVDSSSSPLSHVPETEISETGVPVPSTTTTVTSARQVLPCSIIGGSADPIESDFCLGRSAEDHQCNSHRRRNKPQALCDRRTLTQKDDGEQRAHSIGHLE